MGQFVISQRNDTKMNNADLVALAKLRHALLLALGQLDQPTYALKQLDQFKSDLEVLGIPATIDKWQTFIEGVTPCQLQPS